MFRITRLLCNDIQSQLSLFRRELAAGGPSLAVVSLMKETRTKDQAEQVMSMAKEKQIVTKPLYDSYLGCLADLKLTDLVKDGLAKMIESQLIPDDKSYSALLKSHLENGTHFFEIEKLTDKLAKNGTIGNHGYHEVIRYYCRVGILDIAMKFYNKMIKMRLTPSHAIYNELILAHAKTALGCKGMFDEMRKRGVEPTEETYEVLSRVYQMDSDTCKGLYSGMAKRGILMNAKIAANMITAFGTKHEWEWCKKVWDDIGKAERKPRTETYLSMITHYSQSGDTATMLEVFTALKQTNLVDMQFVNTSLITSHAELGQYDKCIEIHSEMQKESCQPTPETFESLMVAYSKRNNIKTALVFDKLMRDKKLNQKRDSTHALLRCLAHHSDEINANRVLKFMHVGRHPPNYDTFLALFEGARGPSGAVLVRRWLREMEEEADIAKYDAEADVMRVYLAALGVCARGNDAQGALEVFRSIVARSAQENSSKPPTQTQTQTQTQTHGVLNEAYDLVLSTCANAGNMVVCRGILENTRKDNIKLQPTTYNKLVEGFGKIGDLPECRKIAEEMRERQIELDTQARAAVRPLSSGGGLFNTLLDEMEEEEEGNKHKIVK